MSEWQPVRTKTRIEFEDGIHNGDSKIAQERRDKYSNTIMVVRPSKLICSSCGERLLQIHPEYLRRMGCETEKFVCEAQVLAD